MGGDGNMAGVSGVGAPKENPFLNAVKNACKNAIPDDVKNYFAPTSVDTSAGAPKDIYGLSSDTLDELGILGELTSADGVSDAPDVDDTPEGDNDDNSEPEDELEFSDEPIYMTEAGKAFNETIPKTEYQYSMFDGSPLNETTIKEDGTIVVKDCATGETIENKVVGRTVDGQSETLTYEDGTVITKNYDKEGRLCSETRTVPLGDCDPKNPKGGDKIVIYEREYNEDGSYATFGTELERKNGNWVNWLVDKWQYHEAVDTDGKVYSPMVKSQYDKFLEIARRKNIADA